MLAIFAQTSPAPRALWHREHGSLPNERSPRSSAKEAIELSDFSRYESGYYNIR